MTKRNHDPAMTRHVSEFGPHDGKRLPCEPGRRTEYLEPSTGLRLRVTPNGARTWAVYFWSAPAKTTRRLKLGDAKTVTLKRARAKAGDALALVREGRDPYLERRATQDEERKAREARVQAHRERVQARARRAVTFGKIVRAYMEARRTTPGGKFKRKASPNTIASWTSMLKHLGPIEAIPPEDVSTDDFVRVVEGAVEKGGPSMGPRVREFIAQAWRWMEARPGVLGVRLPAVSPLRSLPKDIGAATVERERALSPAEVWSFWKATEAEGLAGLALRFMLLTAARVREATMLPWAEVDLAGKVWTLAAERNKGGRVRVVPLSPQALAVVKAAQAIHEGAHVFGPVRVLNPVMKRIRASMEGEPWQTRDLRRTAATLAGRLGADPFVCGLLLGHAHPDVRAPRVTAVYARWSYDERVKDIVTRLGAWVEETVNASEAPGAVVEFGR